MINTTVGARSLSIRTRLLGVCGALVLISVVVDGLGFCAFRSVNGAFQVAVTESLPAVDHLLQTDRDMQQAVVAERSLMFMKIDTPGAKDQIKPHPDKLEQVAVRWQK